MAQMIIGHVFPLHRDGDELPEGTPIYRDFPEKDEGDDLIDRLDLRDFARVVVDRMKNDYVRKEGIM